MHFGRPQLSLWEQVWKDKHGDMRQFAQAHQQQNWGHDTSPNSGLVLLSSLIGSLALWD